MMFMDIDSNFLKHDFPESLKKPVNVYEILHMDWRESRVDMTLKFLLDPNERHGFGSKIIDALLRAIAKSEFDGKSPKFVTKNELEDLEKVEDFDSSSEYEKSQYWQVYTQVSYTSVRGKGKDGKHRTGIIDVFASNEKLGLALVIENKIGHENSNPLDIYAEYAFTQAGINKAIVVVLAPSVKKHKEQRQENYLSTQITYQNFIDELDGDEGMKDIQKSPDGPDQIRSIELLKQFIEIRSEQKTMDEKRNDLQQLEDWRGFQKTISSDLEKYLKQQSKMRGLISSRRVNLDEMIVARLNKLGLKDYEFQNKSGGNPDLQWCAYQFNEQWTIQLVLSLEVQGEFENNLLNILYYEAPHGKAKEQKKERVVEALPDGITWKSENSEIVEAFINKVKEVLGV